MQFRRYINSAIAGVLLATSVTPSSAAIMGQDGTVFFRYRDTAVENSSSNPGGETESKSVTAFYVAGVGFPVEELLPLKPEWTDDDWRIVSGTLPSGIAFDPSTRTFRGTPTEAATARTVRLEGFDASGSSVAKATVTFDVVVLQGLPVPTTLYAHTGHYKVDELPVPSELPADTTIEEWARLYALPEGIDLDNRYVQGTPTKPGTYRLLVTGKDYKGEVVATYFGKYVVEDGPTFPHISDRIQKLPQLEWGYGLWQDFGAPSPHAVNHRIDPRRGVKYYVEKKDPLSSFPGTTASNSYPLDLNINGWIYEPYETATIRFKAIDADGTIGYSNWFSFGSSDPQPDCDPYGVAALPLKTGKQLKVQIPAFGLQGTPTFRLATGTLPVGLSLDEETGIISGMTVDPDDDQEIMVVVDVTNEEHLVSSRECRYMIEVSPGDTALLDLTPVQSRHVRTGSYYDGRVGVVGGIPDFSLVISDPAAFSWLTLSSSALNAGEFDLSGEAVEPGRKEVPLTLNNGDGTKKAGFVTFDVHGDLSIGPVADLHVRRMAGTQTWAEVPYDATTVIPEVSSGETARFTYTNLGALPLGLTLTTDGYLVGTTSEAPGVYGPFTATVTDFSGQSVTSEEFNVVVDERDPLILTVNGIQKFNVEWEDDQTRRSFSVRQPSGARGMELGWTLAAKDGSAVPAWLTIDERSGNLSVAAGTDYSLIGTHGPFVVTVTDADGSAASRDVEIVLQDWPLPSAGTAAIRGSVTGAQPGEAATTFGGVPLAELVDPATVIGGRQAISFDGTSPALPAGVTLNENGTFGGNPATAYTGPLRVEFTDGKGRPGTIDLDVDIKPYPAASVRPNYSLPRNAFAQTIDDPIVPEKNEGYWNAPEWEVDVDRGTDIASYGLHVDPATGVISGKTDAAEGTVLQNVVLKSTSIGANGEVLRNWTTPFSITVSAAVPMEVVYTPSIARYLLDEGTLVYKGREAAVPTLKGSHKEPVTWSLDPAGAAAIGLVGLSLDPATGAIIGTPSQLGRWDVVVTATDAEGSTNATGTVLRVLSTKSGHVRHPASANVSRILRVDESFSTPAVAVSNAVTPVVFGTKPTPLPSGLTLSSSTGGFEPGSRFSAHGFFRVEGTALDYDQRTFGDDPVVFDFEVRKPLELSLDGDRRAISARQFSAEPGDLIDFAFAPTVSYAIGSISYGIEGRIPGTLVYRTGNTHVIASTGQSVGSAALPADAIVFDTAAATLHGVPSQSGTFEFRLVAADSHRDAYEQDDPTRTVHNTARSQAIKLTVAPAANLELVSSENPKGVVVPSGNGVMSVKPRFAAYGGAMSFSISGAGSLPPGITYAMDGTGVYFSGKFTGTLQQLGSYSGITVSGTDALGRTATLPVAFNVLLSTDPIGLTLSDIRTKAGYPVAMQSLAANHYGALRFYSYDLGSSSLGSQLSLDQASGLLSGTFNSVANYTMNVYVTDATNRVTSKPLSIIVLPKLNLTVPELVVGTQGETLSRTILTDYKIGDVTYEKADPANWPPGVEVDGATGAIKSPAIALAPGLYPNLRIRGTDTFNVAGDPHTDTQLSNVFSIRVDPVDASPVMTDKAKTILGSINSPVTPLIPVVVDSVAGQPWSYEGTVYSASHDLTEYGLTFDPATGRISGTPTEAFVIEDFVLTVTSARGDSDSTAPFWIGVAPKADLQLAAGQASVVNIRRSDDEVSSPPPVIDNVVGNLTFTMNASIPNRYGIDEDGSIVATGSIDELPLGWYQAYTTAYDEFGRSLSFTRDLYVRDALSIAPVANPVLISTNSTVTNKKIVNVSGVAGTMNGHNGNGVGSYSLEGLPAGWTFDPASGTVSGNADFGPAGTTVNVTVKITDPADGTVATTVVPLMLKQANGYTYYRVIDRTIPGYNNYGTMIAGGFGVTQFYDAEGNSLNELIVQNPAPPQGWQAYPKVYSVSAAYDWLHVARDAAGFWKAYRFSEPVEVRRVVADTYAQWNADNTQFEHPEIEASNDGIKWVGLGWSATWPLHQTHLETTRP